MNQTYFYLISRQSCDLSIYSRDGGEPLCILHNYAMAQKTFFLHLDKLLAGWYNIFVHLCKSDSLDAKEKYIY